MKRALAVSCLIVGLLFQSAAAQTAKIDIYSDMAQTSCELNDQGLQEPVVFAYYFLSGTIEATGVRFSAPKPACWTEATFAADVSPFLTIGGSQYDWSIAFGGCMQGTVYVGKSAYIVTPSGHPASCCEMTVVNPGGLPFPNFVWTDCSFAELPLSAGKKLIINPDASCRNANTLPVQPSTWGSVKSLYR